MRLSSLLFATLGGGAAANNGTKAYDKVAYNATVYTGAVTSSLSSSPGPNITKSGFMTVVKTSLPRVKSVATPVVIPGDKPGNSDVTPVQASAGSNANAAETNPAVLDDKIEEPSLVNETDTGDVRGIPSILDLAAGLREYLYPILFCFIVVVVLWQSGLDGLLKLLGYRSGEVKDDRGGEVEDERPLNSSTLGVRQHGGNGTTNIGRDQITHNHYHLSPEVLAAVPGFIDSVSLAPGTVPGSEETDRQLQELQTQNSEAETVNIELE